MNLLLHISQAASRKPQAASRKPQAASRKPQVAINFFSRKKTYKGKPFLISVQIEFSTKFPSFAIFHSCT
ncbi:MAG: hypothetical protein KatS3mg028_0278 [Bacteroidia bacterium]|nr:MAG: hypothetical protein KatS3mg028_0278 [Bacteroidia bacterium]